MRARGSDTRAARNSSQVTLRESAASPFSRILGETVARIAGAYSAILVDADGETVDYDGTGDPYDSKVAAAHVRILLEQIGRPSTGALLSLNVRGSRSSFVARVLAEGYALVVLLRPRASLFVSQRALDWASWALASEAGWKTSLPEWLPVEIECDEAGRPLRARSHVTSIRLPTSFAPNGKAASSSRPPADVQMTQSTNSKSPNNTNGTLYRADVLGTVRGLPAREVGYRVRLENDVETTLIRENGQRWYADVDIESAESRKPPSVRPVAAPVRADRVR